MSSTQSGRQLRYVTVDVFTQRVFGGNPLAVVFDAAALRTTQMQAIAAEFNYSETTFVLPATAPGCAVQVRIFTPRAELPFAGHPNVGTAVCFARECERQNLVIPEPLVFEELAGPIRITVLRDAGRISGAEISAPSPLSIGASIGAKDAAQCLELAASDIAAQIHAPCVVSVGLPFLVVELASRSALARAAPNLEAHQRLLPAVGTDGVFAYTRGAGEGELHARMFAPVGGIREDPATGSASAALIGLLASLRTAHTEERSWRIEQGVEMGRPSLICGRTEKRSGNVAGVHISGGAVPVMQGQLQLPPET
ncbi:MAG TPA: PhzF family phenazine biosynthesis protein [Steroidobacteraceae bacterium]|jgi:trans-2,3-dihydro-3-hydroxyanthranilate isomerase|nr:PhzF family phenazine biosynthesis protein [Steroidobacteraceae bacterium]